MGAGATACPWRNNSEPGRSQSDPRVLGPRDDRAERNHVRLVRHWLVVMLLLAPLTRAKWVRAQEGPRSSLIFHRTVAAPVHALEGQMTAGYSQGVGSFGQLSGQDVQDIAGVGFGAGLGAGYRLSPLFYLGLYAAGSLYSEVSPGTSARSLTAGINTDWHLRPLRSIDPWVGFGVGYRAFRFDPPNQGAVTRHAIEVARIALGVDYRLNTQVAIGPVINVDISLFLGSGGVTPSGNGLSTFVSAGISARFDFLGTSEPRASDIARH